MSRPLFIEDLHHVLDYTRDLWEGMRGQRIFITGGTGFFGSWLLETFAFANEQLNLGAKLTALTRDPEAFRSKAPHLGANTAIELWKGDVRDFEFPGGEFTHVIHAATTSGSPVSTEEMSTTITEGTRRTLDFAVVCKARKFLLTSSGAVYGRQPPGLTNVPEIFEGDTEPGSPNAAYAEGKRMAEALCETYRHEIGIHTKIARCFAFVGPHLPLDAHFAIGNFIRDTLRGKPIHIQGDGTPYRSYLYAADLAIWLWTILFKGEAGRPYNVGSGEAVSIAELAKIVTDTLSPSLSIEIAGVAVEGALPPRYVPDVVRAAIELDLRPWIPLNEAILRTARWHTPDSPV